MLEANLTLLKANFKVLKLEKAKILIVPFVSQVIQSINKIEIQKKKSNVSNFHPICTRGIAKSLRLNSFKNITKSIENLSDKIE